MATPLMGYAVITHHGYGCRGSQLRILACLKTVCLAAWKGYHVGTETMQQERNESNE
jgi:hypothetical protein